MCYKRGGVRRQSIENQVYILLHLHADQWFTSVISKVNNSLNGCDLFHVILVARIK